MNDEIIRMAREAISDTINQHDQMLKRLWCIAYEEGQKAEREACAKVADGELMNTNMLTSYPPKSSAAWNIAAAIRARGEQ